MKNIFLLAALLFNGAAYAKDVVIDVRSAAEYAEGHVSGALNIEHSEIAKEISKFNIGKEDKIILYCRSGRRSAIALDSLKQLGYSKLENYGGLDEARQRLESAAKQGGGPK
ncbi:rhodanese-like domain-containing protein [Paucibacter sp. AS339]|uniref:rhodanese-like domain-containing protein n=1 Tax=Paucibacter hankyongi TaxID=3133434 RepID=UPI0030992EDA